MSGTWREIGDRVIALRYPYLQQNIGLILGDDEAAVIDTRTTAAQAREILRDVRARTGLTVRTVINTHGHADHAFGNAVFRPASIWGHAGCAPFMLRTAERQRAQLAEGEPVLVGELEEVVIDPPDRVVEDFATIVVGGRSLEVRHLGRAHTDHDLVIHVLDCGVLFAGDLVRPGGQPFFGDGFPLDWSDTLRALGELPWTTLSTGHGDPVDRAYLGVDIARHAALAGLARRAHAAHEPWIEVVGRAPFPAETARLALERAYAQLDGTA